MWSSAVSDGPYGVGSNAEEVEKEGGRSFFTLLAYQPVHAYPTRFSLWNPALSALLGVHDTELRFCGLKNFVPSGCEK